MSEPGQTALRAGAAALALLAAACASGPPEQPVAQVSGDERDAYWVDVSPYNVGVERLPGPGQCESSVVTAEYTIGSDGRVSDVTIARSRPTVPRNDYAVKNDLFERRFDPSPDNPQRYPVRVRQEFTVDCGPGTVKWR